MWIKNVSGEPHGFGGHEIAPGEVIVVSDAEFRAAQRNVGIAILLERRALLASPVQMMPASPAPSEPVEPKKSK